MPWSLPWPHRSEREAPAAPQPAVDDGGAGVDAAAPHSGATERTGSAERTRAAEHQAETEHGPVEPLPRLVGPMSLTARSAEFVSRLAGTRGLPPILRPPTTGHSADGPVGIVHGLARPIGGSAPGRTPYDSRLAVEAPAAPVAPGLSVDLGPIRRLPAVEPAAVESAAAYTRVDGSTGLPAFPSRPGTATPGIDAGREWPSRIAILGPAPGDPGHRAPSAAAGPGPSDGRPASAEARPAPGDAIGPSGSVMSMGEARRLGLGAPLTSRPASSQPVLGMDRPDSTPGTFRPAAAGPAVSADSAGSAASPARGPRPEARYSGGARRALPSLTTNAAAATPTGRSPATGGYASASGEGPRPATANLRFAPSASAGSWPSNTSTAVARQNAAETVPRSQSSPGSIQRSTSIHADGPARLHSRPDVGKAGSTAARAAPAGGHFRPSAATTGPAFQAVPLRHDSRGQFTRQSQADAPPEPVLQRSVVSDARPPSPREAAEASGGARPADTMVWRAAADPSAGGANGGSAGAAAGGAAAAGVPSIPEEQLDQLAGQIYGKIRDRLSADLLHQRERAGLLADM